MESTREQSTARTQPSEKRVFQTTCRYVRVPLELPPGAKASDLVTEEAFIDVDNQIVDSRSCKLDTLNWARSCRLVAVSDTHNLHQHLPCLPRGDLLVHCGDFTNSGGDRELQDFDFWLGEAASRNFGESIFCVAGNHDAPLSLVRRPHVLPHAQLLKSQLAKQRLCPPGLRLFGQSWGSSFPSSGLPEPRVDVLLTHGPPWGLLDQNRDGESCGSRTIRRFIESNAPRLHMFGHIHESYGAEILEHSQDRWSLLLNISNAAVPPRGFTTPAYIEHPITVVDIELPERLNEPSIATRKGRQRRSKTEKKLEAKGTELKSWSTALVWKLLIGLAALQIAVMFAVTALREQR